MVSPPLRMIWLLTLMLFVTAGPLATGCPAETSTGEPPLVTLSVGSEESYIVGEDVIQIHVTAKDPMGGSLTFEVVDKPERAQFQTFKNSAIFTWDPITSDVTGETPRRLIFVVTNSRGQSTERVVNVRIRPGNGVPRFLNSASELYNPASGQPLVIDVRVRDDDSREVTLSMPPSKAPEGAKFEYTAGNLQGRFEWLPSPAQAAKRIHSVTFVADDGDNAPVEHKVTIVIRQKESGGGVAPDPGGGGDMCAAEDIIEHTALSAQRIVKDYLVEAKITAQGSRYDSMFVYWTTGDPLNNRDERYDGAPMNLKNGVFQAGIPNPALQSGQSQTIFYTLCAFDDDAPEDDEEAAICTPTSLTYSFIAYSPDDEAGCVDDGDDLGSPQAAAEVDLEAWRYYRACDGKPDYHRIDVYGGELLDVYVIFSEGQALDVKLLDAELNELELYRSDCMGLAMVQFDAPAGGEMETFYLQVSGQDIPYQVSGFLQSGGECPGGEMEPDNTPMEANVVAEDTTFGPVGICTAEDVDVYAVELVEGDLLLAELGFSHATGDLDMTLYAPSQQAQVTEGGNGVAQGWSSDDDESILFQAVESGFYFLSVFTSGEPNIYNLEIATTCGDEDAFAGNGSRQDAALIALDEHNDLKLCAGQADWFRRQGFADTTLVGEVVVEYGGRPSDVTFEVYDSNDRKIAEAVELSGVLDLQFDPPADGQYYFKVASDRRIIYSLTLLQF